MDQRKKQLELLKARRIASTRSNRQQVFAEHKDGTPNPKAEARAERKKSEAEALVAKQAAIDAGLDPERAAFKDYSVEQVERYEAKQQAKADRIKNSRFSDWNQVAEKKYTSLMANIKPDLASYRDAKADAEAGHTSLYRDSSSIPDPNDAARPSEQAITRLVTAVHEQEAGRATRSRRRAHNEEEEVTYINERNMRFNKKVSRAFDKYTREIKDNLERGTAL